MSITDSLRFTLKGAAMGIANIIPGVSGGTMALILGIYERLLRALRGIQPKTLKLMFSKDAKERRTGWLALDLAFTVPLAIGLVLAVLVGSSLITMLLRDHHNPTYGLFFGFVAISAIAPFRLIGRLRPRSVVALGIGALLVLSIAKIGELAREARYDSSASASDPSAWQHSPPGKTVASDAARGSTVGASAPPVSSRTSRPPALPLYFFLAGFVAVAAMLLPGLSGSLVLLLTGMYFPVLRAINDHNLLLIAIFCLGCGFGVLLSARAISWFLDYYYSPTMAFLCGLMIGSLYQLWPFKRFAIEQGERIDIANYVPSLSPADPYLSKSILVTLLATLLGASCVWIMMRREAKQHPQNSV